MRVCQRLVNVRVLMRNVCRSCLCMWMLMVCVMFVHMLVLERRVGVSMVVPLGEMQAHADAHQYSSDR